VLLNTQARARSVLCSFLLLGKVNERKNLGKSK
jgi:hypothetical protein